MPASSLRRACRSLAGALALAVGLGAAVGLGGCDEAPGPAPAGNAPQVTNFDYAPDSVVVADLPADRVQDSVAQVDLSIAARAVDPDGEVAAVLFLFEPASNPQQTAAGTLAVVNDAPSDDVYAARVQVSLPATLREIYTLRVFAVDDDSLGSNQLTGQVRVIPEE